MKPGDLVRGYNGWLARVQPADRTRKVRVRWNGAGPVPVIWQTGQLQGRPALVAREGLRVVG